MLEIDTPRWAGVPFRLRSGKALSNPRQEVVVSFKRAPHIPTGLTGAITRTGFTSASPWMPAAWTLDLNVNGPVIPGGSIR